MSKNTNIDLKNLTKEYISPESKNSFLAVDHINVSIKQGEFVTLLGPSGCGKTTTLRMIAGFEGVTEGDILLNGASIKGLTPDKRDSSMVFQSYALFPHYNVFDNVAYGLVNRKLPQQEIKAKVLEMLKLVGLEGMEKRLPNQLSGGQQQRVALARALIVEPAVLLFDEPLSNLDAKLRVYMRKEIRKLQQRLGITSIYVTHDQSEAMALSDKIIIMNKGRIEQVGTPQEIYQKPRTHFVADFMGNANFVEAEVKAVQGEKAVVSLWNKEHEISFWEKLQAGDKVEVVVRPEAIKLTDSGSFEGEIKDSVYMGAVQEIVLKIGKQLLNVTRPAGFGQASYRVGEKVCLNLDDRDLFLVKQPEN